MTYIQMQISNLILKCEIFIRKQNSIKISDVGYLRATYVNIAILRVWRSCFSDILRYLWIIFFNRLATLLKLYRSVGCFQISTYYFHLLIDSKYTFKLKSVRETKTKCCVWSHLTIFPSKNVYSNRKKNDYECVFNRHIFNHLTNLCMCSTR